jgi:nitroimidazol reductase NimA-like FMN-containing flavoprotein (pyridoxamine 5'-phosphate oxidase superfamily)
MTTPPAELVEPEVERILRDTTLLRLGYDGVDGTPRVIPIGFWWNGTTIVICTATTSPKVKALTQRPAVAASLDEGDTPMDAKALLIRGTAEIEIVDGVPAEYLLGAAKVLEPDQLPAFEQACTELYPQMARISITPAWARFFDFGSGRLPEFLQTLASHTQQPSTGEKE